MKAIVDQVLWHHVASLGHNELTSSFLNTEMAEGVEILPHRKQEPVYPEWSVLASMPSAMANQIDMFSTQNKLLCILSGLQGPYVREWDDIYRNIARFVHRMYLRHNQTVVARHSYFLV